MDVKPFFEIAVCVMIDRERRGAGPFEKQVHLGDQGIDLEADQPSPRRIAGTRETVTSKGVRQVFVELQTNVSLVETIFDGQPVTICEIDPNGSAIPAGAKHYWQSMRELAATLGGCGAS